MNDTRDDTILWFEEGVIGVPRARRFQLLEKADTPVRLLRSLDIDGFCLPVVDPRAADPGYGPRIAPRVTEALGFEADDPVLLLAVAALERDGSAVANLRAPVIVNVRRRVAAQIILDDRTYPLRAPVEATPVGAKTG